MDKKDCEFMDEISADDLYEEHMRSDPFTQGRQDVTISAPEECAFINGFIDKENLWKAQIPTERVLMASIWKLWLRAVLSIKSHYVLL